MSETIQLDGLTVDFDGRFQLSNVNWCIKPNQNWMITGTNGSGKSALAAVLAGFGDRVSGTQTGIPPRVSLVSYEAQGELIAAERRKDDADIMDVISEGTPVREIINQVCVDAPLAERLVEQFGLSGLLDRSFRCPQFITHIAYLDGGKLLHQIACDDENDYAELYQLLHLKTSDLLLPEADPVTNLPPLDPTQPLVRITNAKIQYGDTVIFKDLSWTIDANQHWQLTGPNGSGKTGLLSLITGDHPQCYVNDIFVFGFQRGQGESIWQIKQYIGYVSTALQWEYRVSTSLRNVIISGFFDSIGLYSKYTDRQRDIANEWLDVLGMLHRADEPFNKLSYGDQRLLLIARAMVKHPPLLVLDEPCLGLDDMNRQRILALIERICAGSETAVLYVNHHPEDKIRGIDRYLALD